VVLNFNEESGIKKIEPESPASFPKTSSFEQTVLNKGTKRPSNSFVLSLLKITNDYKHKII